MPETYLLSDSQFARIKPYFSTLIHPRNTAYIGTVVKTPHKNPKWKKAYTTE